MWVTYDEDGKVTRAAGGGYTLNGVTRPVPRPSENHP
jgi:hypothetical protein